MKGQPHDHKHLMPTQIIPGTGITMQQVFSVSLLSFLYIHLELPFPPLESTSNDPRIKELFFCLAVKIVNLMHVSHVTVLTELVKTTHSLREKHCIKSHCPCTSKQNLLNKLPATNGVSQVLLTPLGHSDTVTVFLHYFQNVWGCFYP